MNRNGFTLIEVVVGLIILTVGVLAMAASTGYTSLRVRAADVRTERSTAYEQASEELRATDFDSVGSVAYAKANVMGSFKVWWSVDSLDWALKNVTLYSEGPGIRGGVLTMTARDTTSVRIARPYP